MDLEKILTGKKLFPVFQPIVSLETGDILGYEAFTRIEGDSAKEEKSIAEFFEQADKSEKSWMLEKICRKMIIKTAKMFGLSTKLFININLDIIQDEEFYTGFTKKLLKKYGLNPNNVVLEITERCSIENPNVLSDIAKHYREQDFSIALDNVGSSYSGLERICNLNPDFVKIDIKIVRGIEENNIKQSMVKNIVQFCHESGIGVIAVGVETSKELETLLKLGVNFAQGFFIARPQKIPGKVNSAPYARIVANRQNLEALKRKNLEKDFEKEKVLKEKNELSKDSKKAKKSIKDDKIAQDDLQTKNALNNGAHKIGELADSGITFFPDTSLIDLMNFFHLNPTCSLVTVVDLENRVLGIMSRSVLSDLLGGQFGFGLNSHKMIRDKMITDFLAVDWTETPGKVASKATARDEKNLYEPVIVEKEGKYFGVVTIKELLDSIVTVEVNERTREITRKNRLLQNQQQIQARDMKMAELVQKSFYPSKAPKGNSWECSFIFKPMASVSGDLYDFYYNKNGKFTGLGLFDVSGHGVASGLVGILSKYLAEKIFNSDEKKPLNKIIQEFSSTLIEAKGAVENYLTGIFLRLNENHIEYVNGGHTDILLKKASGKVSILGEEDNSFRGMFLGMQGLPEGDYGVFKTDLEKGDCLLLYTDCLIESRNLAGDEMGVNLLKKIFSKAPADNSKKILEYLIDVFDAYTEAVPLRDDLTVIVLKYVG